MKIQILLTSETFQALLVGKKLCIKTPEYELTIYPPHYGVYLTLEQIAELKHYAVTCGLQEMWELLDSITNRANK